MTPVADLLPRCHCKQIAVVGIGLDVCSRLLELCRLLRQQLLNLVALQRPHSETTFQMSKVKREVDHTAVYGKPVASAHKRSHSVVTCLPPVAGD